MLNLYAETAIAVKEGATPKRRHTVIPRANGSYDRSKHSKKPHRHDRLATDDKSYAAEYLASASSAFFRHDHDYPRSFYWRVFSHDRLLQLSTCDFARHEDKDGEADAVLTFEFQDPISPRGVTICDLPRSTQFHVFVLTKENEVFELRLDTTYFQDPDSIPADPQSWCFPIRASSLSIDRAFHIQATNPQDVFVSFVSGKVQHWKRDDTDQQWSHVNYDEKSWGSSLFSMVTRKGHPDIDFEGLRLAYNTTHAMARSGQYLFTVCLNHTLRIWHLSSGNLVDTRDLLDQARDPRETLQLKPAEPGYVQILEGSGKKDQILMTYSPLDGGRIKLWRVQNTFEDDSTLFSIQDAVPSSNLLLPDPDPSGNSIWMLAGLKIVFDKYTKQWQAWALWRNNNHHRAYTLNFDMTDVADSWRDDWIAVLPPTLRNSAPDFVLSDAEDATTKWSKFILFPGRYPLSLLETALVQYANVLNADASLVRRNKPLQERLTALLSAQVSLRRYDDGTLDHDRFALDTDRQWRQFWRVLDALNDSRVAPLSLAVDSVTGTVLFSMADSCCVIREAGQLELLRNNDTTNLDELDDVLKSRWSHRKLPFSLQEAGQAHLLLAAARRFFDSFSPELLADFLQTLDDDLFHTIENSATPQRVIDFFNHIDLANAITDDAEKELLKDLSKLGKQPAISTGLFKSVIQYLVEHKARSIRSHLVKTDFGVNLTFTSLFAELQEVKTALLSLLAVIVFVDESDTLDPAQVFDDLVSRLQNQERNIWLASHHRDVMNDDGSYSSILECIYNKAIRPQSSEHHPLPYLVTRHVQDYVELITNETAFGPKETAVYLQCWLLKNDETVLATDFLKFQPATAWSRYVRGRLTLALGQFDEALEHFKAAATEMSSGKALGKLEDFSAGLLTSQEAAHFYGGLPLYLQHVVRLFEGKQAYKEAAEVSQACLQSLDNVKPEPTPNFRQTILHRLFDANIKISQFDAAFDALIQFTDPVLQRQSTVDLTDMMLSSIKSSSDVSSTVKHIQNFPLAAHPQLMVTIDSHLSSLAKKQAVSILPSTGWLTETNSSGPVDYLSVLHALRLSRKDYRGAVAVLFERLRMIQKSGRARADPQATQLRHALLALINCLTCVDETEAYIIADSREDPRAGGQATGLKRLRPTHDDSLQNGNEVPKRRRIVVTLYDLRREYQKVLDRCSRIERGDFEFNANGDVDDEDDDVWEGSRLHIDNSRGAGPLVLNNDRMDVG